MSQCSLFTDSMFAVPLLAKISRKPQINTGGAFTVIGRLAQSGENFESSARVPTAMEQSDSLASRVGLTLSRCSP